MKKIISILVVTVMLAAAFSVSAFAADSVNVTVTISDGNGNIAVCLEEMTVTDTDGDGKFTVYDVLATADPEGFEAETTQWGLSIKQLCGVENGGSYGYYVNHQMAMGLTDEVKDGDYVAAFVYVDAKGLSDAYSYVELSGTQPDTQGFYAFEAKYSGWDDDWNPLVKPIEGAFICIDDEVTEQKTDENGFFVLEFAENGEHIITVMSEDRNYACAVYALTVNCFGEEAGSEDVEVGATDPGAPANDAPTTGADSAPQTGDATIAVIALAAIAGAAAVVTAAKRKED